MNTEEQHNAKLSQIYQADKDELPPASLDAAIIAAAKREVDAKPRAIAPFSSRWTVPVSIAAAVVLTVSLVTLVPHDIMSPVDPVNLEDTQDYLAPKKQQDTETKEALGKTYRLDEQAVQSSKPMPMPNLPAAATPRPFEIMQAEEPIGPSDSQAPKLGVTEQQGLVEKKSEVTQANRKRFLKKKRTKLPQSISQDQRDIQPLEEAFSIKDQPARTKAASVENEHDAKTETLLQEIPGRAIRAQSVSVPRPIKDWLAHIKSLKAAGKHAEAEKEINAFKEHYPDYPLVKLEAAIKPD